jgi:hypothetical protein
MWGITSFLPIYNEKNAFIAFSFMKEGQYEEMVIISSLNSAVGASS